MPRITALAHLSLSVIDLSRSVEWYTRVLGFVVDSEVEGATFRRARLRHAGAPFTLTLTQHDEGSLDRFQETRVGLDHLAFLVPTVAEVEAFEKLLDEHEVPHSEVKWATPDVARIIFRDPDNIQLEVMAAPPLPS